MLPSPPIHRFLVRARRRARRERWLRHGALLVTAACGLVFVLACIASWVGPAPFWPVFATRVLPVGTLSVFALLVLNAWRTTRSDTTIARLVGRGHPPVASDLLSALQLKEHSAAGTARTSSSLLDAFMSDLSERLAAIDLRAALPYHRARRALLVLMAALLALTTVTLMARGFVGRGLHLLLHTPTRFEGARVSKHPLVGDVRITYTYPAYTRLPTRTVEDSSGDLVAPRGTHATLRMRALRSARRALLLLGEAGDGGEIEARVLGNWIEATLRIEETTRYRVWLAPLVGRPIREDRGHRIEALADTAPTVEIRAAADRLELPAPRPVEIGYSATDDYGLGPIDLVFRVGMGPEKRQRLEDGSGRRNVTGKTIWDASNEALVPGVEISYRIEARDQDTVLGAKTGSSRTLTLVLERPRESLDESIEEQRRILERLLSVLADRLELTFASEREISVDIPAVNGTRSLDLLGADPTLHLQALHASHNEEAQQVVLLGRVVDQHRRTGTGNKALLQALSGIADRLNAQLRDESEHLYRLRDRRDRSQLGTRELAAFHRRARPHVRILEEGCLLLDDLIGRQRLEDLAAFGQQLRTAHERLRDLLARYKETQDEGLKQQLLAEMAALKRKIAELAAKLESVRQRNEVPTEWQNLPDPRHALAQARRLEEHALRGDTAALDQALEDLGKELAALQDALASNANEFNAERFPRESRALNELTRQISELEGDQRMLAEDTQALHGEIESALDDTRRARTGQLMQRLDQQMRALDEKVGPTAPRQAGSRADDAHARARDHLERTRQAFAGRDFAEAASEAEAAARALAEAQQAAERRAGREGFESPAGQFSHRMREAASMAKQLAEELGQLLPHSSEIASDEQRKRALNQAERQHGLEGRTRELGKQAGKEGDGLPAFDRARAELEATADQMRRAGEDLRNGRVREALAKERAAIERLSNLRESMQKEQIGQGSHSREPVPIPGERPAPRAWREELLEAMRERAPESFREEVRRYYEELVR